MKTFYSFVSLLVIMTTNLLAGDIDVSSLPKLLGSNNMGKEFYFTFIPAWDLGWRSDLKLYITSNVKTNVTVEVEGKGYSKTKTTVPNDIIEFRLVPSLGQVYSHYPGAPPEPDQVWTGEGVHVYSDDPIICYGVTRYSYTSDGFLALPVHTLGKEYIVASYADASTNDGQWLPSYTGITAPYDKTKVFFTMGGTDSSRTAGGQLPEQTTSWTLNRGDVLLFASFGQNAELSGSKIVATKPVSVVSGNFCAYIPTDCGFCDVIEEMEMPTDSWGREYHVTPIINRIKHSIIRIFAKEENTTIYRDYDSIGFIANPGGISNIGWLDMRADTGLPRPVIIHANKPISVTQYNTSQLDDNIVSDPFQMVLVPTEQYQKEMTFNTPGIRGGFGFPYNYINLCYEATAEGTIPDDLMFAQLVGNEFEWSALKEMAPTPGKPFANVDGSKNYYSKTILLPGDGVYKIKADKPFQAYSYGWSSYDSYGNPASANLKRLDIEDTEPPEPRWKLECDGNVNVNRINYVRDKPDNEVDRSNLSLLYMHSDKSYNYKFNAGDFMPCEVQTVPWSLEVIDNSEDALAVVTFADCNGNDTTVIIEYAAVKLSTYPKIMDYGLNDVGQQKDKLIYVVNHSETKAIEVNFLKLQRTNQNFSLWDSSGSIPLPAEFNTPLVIEPLDSFPLIVRFDATIEGEFWDSIGIGDTCNFWFKSYISAMVGTPIIEVTDWYFPPTMIGYDSYGQLDFQNKGTVTLEIYDYSGPFIWGIVSNKKIFASNELEELNITRSTPLRIKPNESKTFQVKFTPDERKSFPDSIVFISNSIKDPQLNNGNPIDSIFRIDGLGIMSDLKASNYNWERKRIHRPGTFPTGPYPAVRNKMNPDTAIRLYNGGNAAVTINRIVYTQRIGDTLAFKFKISDLYRTLDPEEEVIVPVTFQPTQSGQHYLEIRFDTSPYIPNITTTLQGIGIIPRIETQDVDFGATAINDYNNPSFKSMTIRNLSLAEWQYGDSVSISDFSEVNINPEIMSNWTSFAEPFRYDKGYFPFFGFPIIIQPGESLSFVGEFVAKSKGLSAGSLTTISDAETEVTSNWIGYDSSYVDVEEYEESGFHIYPNPTTNTINLRYHIETADKIDIFMTDVLGNKTLLKSEYKSPGDFVETFNLNVYPQGIYNIVLQTGNEVYNRRIVLMK